MPRRFFWGCLAGALLTSCGVAADVGQPPSRGAVAICAPSPATGTEVRPDTSTDFAVWVGQQPDLFAGAWWDSVSGEYVFAATDPETARTLILQVFPADASYRIDEVPRGASALRALQQRVLNVTKGAASVLSSSRREWDGRVQIDLGVLDPAAIGAVELEFADELDAVCVTGIDPASIPQSGPQPRSGTGWRLLADPIDAGRPYHVDVALTDNEYQTLWASLASDGEQPAVDFNSEIVVQFTVGVVATCPEERLDGVVIDTQRSLISPEIVSLSGIPACTALGEPQPRTYLLALDKAALPAVPFTVSLSGDIPPGPTAGACRDCKQVTNLNP